MIQTPKRLYLKSNKFPFEIVEQYDYFEHFIVKDINHNEYIIQKISVGDYIKYRDLTKYSSKIKKSIFEYKEEDSYFLVFDYENKTEYLVKSEKNKEIYLEIFSNSSFEIKLRKEHLVNMNNIYKVLDNKFNYFEIRIREIEISPIKDDVSWVVLSKYNIILDAKIYLYDLQQDLFKMIDKNETIKYGLIPKRINNELYSNNKLLLNYNFYYGPIGILYARFYLSDIEFSCEEVFKKNSIFDQKYFLFMSLYILILNINMEIRLDARTCSNYLLITRKIKKLLVEYKEILNK